MVKSQRGQPIETRLKCNGIMYKHNIKSLNTDRRIESPKEIELPSVQYC